MGPALTRSQVQQEYAPKHQLGLSVALIVPLSAQTKFLNKNRASLALEGYHVAKNQKKPTMEV